MPEKSNKLKEKETVAPTQNKPESIGPAHRSRQRRKMLASMVAGTGTVVAGKMAPMEWKRPIIESVILPAHAGTSRCEINCAVTGSILENDGGEDLSNDEADANISSPGGGWQPGGVIQLDGFDCDTDAIEISGVTAEVCGGAQTNSINVSISGNAQDDNDDGQGQNFDIESGGSTTLQLDASDVAGIFAGEDSADLSLTFSNPDTQDCTINFQFNCVEPV